MRHLPRLLLAPLALVVAASASACTASEDGDASGTTSTSAFTVDHGDRFVVSATPERIVLRRHAGDVAFPFDEAALIGKAILIHPVDRRAVTGVYARAESVESVGDTFVVTSKPLSLSEMASMTESEIVRIFVPAQGSSLSTRSFSATGSSSGLGFTGYVGLARPALLSPGITAEHVVDKAEIQPNVLLEWTPENGLELGIRASLSWRSTLTIQGTASGEFFRSQTVVTPPFVVAVPIGPVPVPVSLSAAAFVSCSASLKGVARASVTLNADATVGGSVLFDPRLDRSSLLRAGSWPAEASGSASVTHDLAITAEGNVTCRVPRIELRALVAGVAGAFIAVVPVVSLTGSTANVKATLAAGVEGELFGAGGATEKQIFEWSPKD